MKKRPEELAQKLLVLLRLDSQAVFDRIIKREKDYLFAFSLHRKREHFKDIFENKYKDVQIDLLKNLSEEVIVALDRFYTSVEKMYWYLKHTQDMGNTVEDKLLPFKKNIRDSFQILSLFIDAELNGEPLGSEELPQDLGQNDI